MNQTLMALLLALLFAADTATAWQAEDHRVVQGPTPHRPAEYLTGLDPIPEHDSNHRIREPSLSRPAPPGPES